jgi:hypothetical protein
MLMAKVVCEILGVKAGWLRDATYYLGNVGRKSHRQGVVYSDDDVDRIKELRDAGWKKVTGADVLNRIGSW